MTDSYQLVTFGNESEPVVIIDDFTDQFEQLKAGAESAEFSPVPFGYPGIRAPVSPAYLREHQSLLANVLRGHFAFSHGISLQGADYSIVTTPAGELKQSQRMPHYDDTAPDLLALLHYINCPDNGGTAFYRHKTTGFETITPERREFYSQTLAQEMEEYGPFPARYLDGDNERFEKIGEVEGIPNRLVIYRGRTLHSGCIRPDARLAANPSHGRLTINIFAANIQS